MSPCYTRTKPIAVNQFETQPYYQRTPLVEYCQAHDSELECVLSPRSPAKLHCASPPPAVVVTAHTSLGSPGNVMASFHKSKPLMQVRILTD